MQSKLDLMMVFSIKIPKIFTQIFYYFKKLQKTLQVKSYKYTFQFMKRTFIYILQWQNRVISEPQFYYSPHVFTTFSFLIGKRVALLVIQGVAD